MPRLPRCVPGVTVEFLGPLITLDVADLGTRDITAEEARRLARILDCMAYRVELFANGDGKHLKLEKRHSRA